MPRISALPTATTASLTDEFPLVQGAVTKRISFLSSRNAGLFLPGPASINTLELVDDSVTSDKLAASASVDANRAVTEDHIRSGAVSSGKLAALSIATANLQDLSVTNAKLDAGSLSISKFNTPDQTFLLNSGTARPGGTVITNGFVKSIVVWQGGSGYVTAPTITIANPTGAGGLPATAIASISGGAVTGITLTSEGTGYKSDPVVTITPPPAGTQAKAYAYAIPHGLATIDPQAGSNGCQHGSIIMTADRKLKAFGYNGYGQKGVAADTGVFSLPAEVFLYTFSNTQPMPVKWYLSGGSAWLIDETGNVWSTGYNGYGQLGYAGTSNSGVFQNINPTFFANKKVIKLATCPASSTEAMSVFALTADGSVYAWGYNGYGQLGIGNVSQQNSPVLVPGTGTSYIISDVVVGSNVTSSTGIVAMIVSNVNNQILCAGYNGHGALSNGGTGSTSTLTYWRTSAGVPLQNATQLHVCGDYPSLAAVTSSGELWTAGYNGYGELGSGNFSPTGSGFATRVINSGVSLITGVGGYYGSRVALMTNGTIRVFGYNGYGQLGNGGVTSNSTPTDTFSATAAGRTVVRVACSQWNYQTTALLLNDGSIFCAGYDGYSKQGRQDGQSLSSRASWGKFLLTRTDVVDIRWQGYNQYSHIEVLTSDGKVYSVGYNGNGDLCRGDATDRYGISNYLL